MTKTYGPFNLNDTEEKNPICMDEFGQPLVFKRDDDYNCVVFNLEFSNDVINKFKKLYLSYCDSYT